MLGVNIHIGSFKTLEEANGVKESLVQKILQVTAKQKKILKMQ